MLKNTVFQHPARRKSWNGKLDAMQNYKRGGHMIRDCKYHLVWVMKYRYPVLGGDAGLQCRELLREITRSKEMIIYAGSINRDLKS